MKVLVADDEIVSRRLIESSVRRWGYDVVVASDGVQAARILQGPDAPKLAVLDWLMPGLDGVQLCRRLREHKRDDAYTYILLLTAKRTRDDIIAGLESGADDYITKPFDPQELRVRLRAGKRILSLMDQLVSAREAFRELAAHDPLTGLWNHNSVIEILRREMHRGNRQGTPVGVVLADLDQFKQINDAHGHLVGDHVLRETAKSLRAGIRTYDAVGRYGGEEFLVVLPGCDGEDAIRHAERLRLAVSRLRIDAPTGEVRVTASFGVTVAQPDTHIDTHTVIHASDTALYKAKHAGRNCVKFAPACAEMVSA